MRALSQRTRALRAHWRDHRDAGTTLTEMVVALVIFGIVSAALVTLLVTTAGVVGASKSRSVAASIATSVMDEARAQGAVSVTPGRTTTTRTVGGRAFTVVRDAQFVARGATSGCTSPGVPSFVRVRVAVEWAGMGSVRPVETDTLLTPRVGDVDAATGSLAVSVVDRAGAPLPDVPVTLAAGAVAGSGTVQRTTEDGCAYFALLSPGTYTASLGRAGYVDTDGVANPSKTTSVTASTNATLHLKYDAAAGITVVADTDTAHPAPNDLPVTLYSPTVFTNATRTRVVSGTAPLVVPGLFPDPAGYAGWAGGCLAHDPGEQLRRPPAATEPGGDDGRLVVGVARFEVLRDRGGLPGTAGSAGWRVTATHAPDEQGGCPAGETHVFASTAADTLGGALPYGTWTFTLTDGARTSPPETVTFAPGETAVTPLTLVLP